MNAFLQEATEGTERGPFGSGELKFFPQHPEGRCRGIDIELVRAKGWFAAPGTNSVEPGSEQRFLTALRFLVFTLQEMLRVPNGDDDDGTAGAGFGIDTTR